MGTRRQARESALQFLYQWEYNHGSLEPALEFFWKEHPASPRVRQFAEQLIRGVVEKQPELDAFLSRCTDNWDLSRLGAVERNVMRIALYEMLHRPDIPPAVSINEAVDIAKAFCDSESGHFVNGVLDRARAEIGRDSRH